MLIHQDTHKFRDRNSRMGIVELEGNLLVELADIFMFPHILLHRFLYGRRDEEILLF